MSTSDEAPDGMEASWIYIQRVRQRIDLNAMASASLHLFPHFLKDLSCNLLFVLAYDALGCALESLRDAGKFSCSGKMLGALMEASQERLGWLDYPLVEEGKNKRNDLVHRFTRSVGAEPLPRAECWKYVDAIGRELTHWDLFALRQDAI
jgi:hypothetical protein